MSDINIKEGLMKLYENHSGFLLPKEQRDKILVELQDTPLPSQKQERFRHTSLKGLFEGIPEVADKSSLPDDIDELVEQFTIEGQETNRLVFFNGNLLAKYSRILDNAGKFELQAASANLGSYPLGEIRTDTSKSFFVSYNAAFAREGYVLSVKDNAVLENPVHIINISGNKDNYSIAQMCNTVKIGKNSQTTLIESYHSISDGASLGNVTGNVVLEQNAVLDLYLLQSEGDNNMLLHNLDVKQMRDSTLNSVTITISGKLVINDITNTLTEENVNANLSGLNLSRKQQIFDNHVLVKHLVPNCQSDQLFRGIVDDTSKVVFLGEIFVDPLAQKTLAYQSNNNILLSPDAKVNSKPQLEIYADDVKCSHGSTTGQLDKEALFYMQTRGLSKENARAMLLGAFAGSIINKIKIGPLAEKIKTCIENRLSGEDKHIQCHGI